MNKVIISGGGTGGHIFPALAIADAIKDQFPQVEILFVGALGKMEMNIIPKYGYKIIGLPIAGLQRSLTIKNLLFPFKLLNSIIKANRIISDFMPNVAIGVGGYASGPLLKAASRRGIPIMLQEQNSIPGITNRLLGKSASLIFVAYEGMERYFAKAKLRNIGNPLRNHIFLSEAKKVNYLNTSNLHLGKKTIFVTGGSLGALTLNDALKNGFEQLEENENIQWIWQSGKYYYQKYKNSKSGKLSHVHITEFVEDISGAYSASDLIIARAGAITISELCLIGKPTILIPSPNVAEDHQTANAKALELVSATRIVKDINASNDLVSEAFNLINDSASLNLLATNISKLAKPNAAKDIVSAIDEYLKNVER